MKESIKYLLPLLLLAACTGRPAIPASYTETQEAAIVYPCMDSTVAPPNIAPLNCRYEGAADEVVARLGSIIACTDGEEFCWDEEEWHALLDAHRGKTLPLDIWTRHGGQWSHHPTQHITVAEEEIDSFLIYRLIEPGYELYRQMGLYERNLTNFDERVLVENNRQYDSIHNHCLNCHNFQANDTRRWLFHIRGRHGGTMVVEDGVPRKVDMRHDSILAAGVYPAWHPTENLVVLSTNVTGQMFHMQHRERIEVLDSESDLILYDPEQGTVGNIFKTDSMLETFPCWAPDGERLYYCAAPAARRYDRLIYSIYSIARERVLDSKEACDPPRLEVSNGSCAVPRVSPDGRYLLYTRADYGQFHIWHASADLWVKDLLRDTCYALTAANSPEADSYHAWSSNGRWIVFASRRDDKGYSRVYISYFDSQGHAHRPIMLPQRRAIHNTLLLKSYNVPELVKRGVPCRQSELQEAVLLQEAQKARYR